MIISIEMISQSKTKKFKPTGRRCWLLFLSAHTYLSLLCSYTSSYDNSAKAHGRVWPNSWATHQQNMSTSPFPISDSEPCHMLCCQRHFKTREKTDRYSSHCCRCSAYTPRWASLPRFFFLQEPAACVWLSAWVFCGWVLECDVVGQVCVMSLFLSGDRV